MKKLILAGILAALTLVVSVPAFAENYILLSAKSSFQEQVKGKTGAVLEIRDDFDLKGATCILPEGVTLLFHGGSLNNGTVDFNGAMIEGTARINCSFKGAIANDQVNFAWFGLKQGDSSFDNAKVINKVSAVYKDLYLPKGTYYFTTPIVIPDGRRVDLWGDLVYQGAVKQTAMKVSGTNLIFNLYGMLSCYKHPRIDYSGWGEKTYIIGIDFVNINNSLVYLNEVKYFNENVRLSGLGGGCSYNKFSFGIIRNANVGLRIYQENVGGKRGWANENLFLGGRFCNFSDWVAAKNKSCAVKIEGPVSSKDTYDTANGLHFSKQSFEGYETIVLARNVSYSDFLYARLEGSKVFVKFTGNCKENRVVPDYDGNCRLWDDSETTMFPIALADRPKFQIANVELASSKNLTDATSPVVTVDCSKTKVFQVTTDNPCRVQVIYVEDAAKKQIAASGMGNYRAPVGVISPKSIVLYSARHLFMNGSDAKDVVFRVPDNVSKIQVRLNGTLSKAAVYSYDDAAAASVVK